MKIIIKFPEREGWREEVIDVDLRYFTSVNDIVEYVLEVLSERYVESIKAKRRREVKERYKAGLRKWLPAKLVVALLEAIGE
ncbi:MAG: hypothetical protein QXK88_10645 [Desulfurococcaceae archaeon]